MSCFFASRRSLAGPLFWHVSGGKTPPSRRLPLLLLLALLLGIGPVRSQAFRHPGVLNSQAELDFVRAKIAANQQPWKQAFDNLAGSPYASLTYTASPYVTVACGSYNNPNIGCTEMVDDGMAAYSQALMWAYGRDPRHASIAIAIMNAWSARYQNNTESNSRLVVAWATPWFVNAAEIIRYTNAGWSSADIARFEGMLGKFLPYVKNDDKPYNNWIHSRVEAQLAIAVFTNNRTEFNEGTTRWTKYVRNSIYQQTDAVRPSWASSGLNGMTDETCRDLGHLKLGINSMMYAGQIAWEQGVDLFGPEKKRLTDFFELHGGWMTGSKAVPSSVCGGQVMAGANDATGIQPPNGGGGAAFEIAYNHLHSRLNYSALPYTLQLINRHRPATAGHWVFKWETLTHGSLPFNLSTSPANPAPAVSFASPQNGATFTAPAQLVVTVNASDAGGAVASVGLYLNNVFVRNEVTAPYIWNQSVVDAPLTNMAAGTYTLRATATDNAGQTTSTSITVTVQSGGGTPPTSASGVSGPACGAVGSTVSFSVKPDNYPFRSASWWTNTGTPVNTNAANTSQMSFTLPASAAGSSIQVTAGVNINVAPWYVEYTKTVQVGNCPAGRAQPVPAAFPLPFAASTTLHLADHGLIDEVVMYNMKGVEVYRARNLHRAEVEVGNMLLPGLYVAHLYSSTGLSVVKLLKSSE